MRLPSKLHPPIAFAHRGARAHAKENTAEAFDLAIRLGATGIESDVWITADDQLILTHDGTMGLRRRQIATMHRSDLPENWITLPELFERVPETVDLSIDVKTDNALPTMYEWLATLDPIARGRIYLCHHDWTVLAEWRARDEFVRLVDSTSMGAMSEGAERRAFYLSEAKIDAVNLHNNQWTGGYATLFHRFGLLCFGWDAQHARIQRDLLRMGLDGIYSDHVDIMMESLAEHLADGQATEPKI